MKVGDLVRLLDDPWVRESNDNICREAVGIVIEIDSPGFRLPAAWVQFSGRSGQHVLWIKELEIVSESR